jgi:hypothetical protein
MASVVAVTGLMMASVAGAVDKLMVKDGSGNTMFNVTDTGALSIGHGTPTTPLHILAAPGTGGENFETVYDTGSGTPFLRYKLNKAGASAWYLKDGANLEVGRIVYSTPTSFPGILIQTGPLANLNRFDIVNMATNFKLYYNGMAGGLSIANTTNNVGIGIDVATSKLQVVGLPVYANNAAAVAAGLTAGAFYRTGVDPDPVCVVH